MTRFPVSQLQHNPVFISKSLVVTSQIALNSESIKPHSLSSHQYLLGVWDRLWGEGFPPSKLFLLLRSIPLSYHDQDLITQYLLFQLLPRWAPFILCCFILMIAFTVLFLWPNIPNGPFISYLIFGVHNYVLYLCAQTYFLQHVKGRTLVMPEPSLHFPGRHSFSFCAFFLVSLSPLCSYSSLSKSSPALSPSSNHDLMNPSYSINLHNL